MVETREHAPVMKRWTFRVRTPMIGTMGKTVTRRDLRHALGLSLGLGLHGCGPIISLDPPAASSSSGSSVESQTTQGPDDPTSADSTTDQPPDDVSTSDVPPVLPPGACPEGCTVDLAEVWTWEEELEPPLPSERRITAMTYAPDGSIVFADMRDGAPWLSRVSQTGVLFWSVPVQWGCPCEVTSMAISPAGKLLVGGQGMLFGETNVYTLGRFDLLLAVFEWTYLDSFYEFFDHPARMGSIFAIDEAYAGLLVVEANIFGDPSTSEALEVLTFQNGSPEGRFFVDSQPYGEMPWRPLARGTPDGGVVVSFTDTAGSQNDGYLVSLDTFFEPTSVEPLPIPAEVLVMGPGYEVIAAGHEVSPRGPVAVHISQARPGLPIEWTHSEDVTTAVPTVPAVIVDSTGAVITALRLGDEDPDDSSLRVWRIESDGTPAWTVDLPLVSDPNPQPVFLEVDEEDALVFGTVAHGAMRVDKREQGCQCG